MKDIALAHHIMYCGGSSGSGYEGDGLCCRGTQGFTSLVLAGNAYVSASRGDGGCPFAALADVEGGERAD